MLKSAISRETICARNIGNNEKSVYSISSLMASEQNKFVDYFKYKASTPTQMIIDDNKNLNKIIATPKEKIAMLNLYRAVITATNMCDQMDISGDYLATLAELDSKQKVYKK